MLVTISNIFLFLVKILGRSRGKVGAIKVEGRDGANPSFLDVSNANSVGEGGRVRENEAREAEREVGREGGRDGVNDGERGKEGVVERREKDIDEVREWT